MSSSARDQSSVPAAVTQAAAVEAAQEAYQRFRFGCGSAAPGVREQICWIFQANRR
jgi:hypothetical protein